MAVRVEREHGRNEIPHDRALLVGLHDQEIEVIDDGAFGDDWHSERLDSSCAPRIAVPHRSRDLGRASRATAATRILLQRQRERLAHGSATAVFCIGHGSVVGISYEPSRFTTLVLSATFVISTCTSMLKICR